ncbi:MAG: hypothetical protein GY724_24300, partial [Actinomycetia bacterium]|nr:hypothetical protein [Actinomycetes bacterium]
MAFGPKTKEKAMQDEVDVHEPEIVDGPTNLPAKAFNRDLQRQGFDGAAAIEELQFRIKALKLVRPATLAQLVPSDFVIFGDKCYLQEKGAVRLIGLLGITYPNGEKPTHEIIPETGGGYTVMVTGKIGSAMLKTTDFVIGGRSSNSKFYDKFDAEGRRIEPELVDVVKAAYTNFKIRAYGGMLGVQGMTPEELKTAGFDRAGEIGGVQFKSGSKGGGSTLIAHWGPGKGKPYTELDDKDLRGYLKNAQGQLDDPEKAKFKKNNEKVISHITDIL